jgi:hypothetical protein
VIIVVGVAMYVYGIPNSFFKGSDRQSNIVANVDTLNPIGTSSIDWQKAFYDMASSSKIAIDTNVGTSTEKLTNIDLLGRKFFITYSQLQQAGLENDKDAIDSATNQLLSETTSSIPDPLSHKISEIKTVADESQASLKTYAEKIIGLFNTYLPVKNEAIITATALDSEDMTILKQIDPIVTGYQTLISGLISMSVPVSFSAIHLDLLNRVEVQLYNAKALRNLESDPVKALNAVTLEATNIEALYNSISALESAIAKRGITFANTNNPQ